MQHGPAGAVQHPAAAPALCIDLPRSGLSRRQLWQLEVELHRRLWHASDVALPPWVPDRSMCPLLEPADLR
eukprot:2011135-Pyramimonas_sp.AAC.1